MNFCSDNITGACPSVMQALSRFNEGSVMPYGDDPVTVEACERLSGLFETEATVFPVATGTAANALALGALTPPYGAIYCHENSHTYMDECGAPEMYTGGARLVPLRGDSGKIDPVVLKAAFDSGWAGVVHHMQPAGVSLAQATECGTLYTPDEVQAIAAICRNHGLFLHMDGARFANALVGLGCTPAEASWKAGVDVLSFGATKNGALAAEAVVFFGDRNTEKFPYQRKRAAHLLSKMRFVSAQLVGYLEDDVWLSNAAHANAMAARLAEGLAAIPGIRLAYPVQANEVFVILSKDVARVLQDAGFLFHPWDSASYRLVTAWNTRVEDVDALVDCAGAGVRAAE